ncbi:MBL fold metallo-hydrolase [Micromonospora sp. 4G55]|nr:MBL fold metallo-hydrolase [Micromonospora sp. 4G55]
MALITDERGSVLVDAGHSPGHAREIRAALAAAGLPEPRWLVYTHHHWDHVWGACAWPGVEIVGHAAGEPLLRAEAARPWSHRYLREQVRAEPRLGPASGPAPWPWTPGTTSWCCRPPAPSPTSWSCPPAYGCATSAAGTPPTRPWCWCPTRR